jgi:glycosyltransferase involved in cell wall biosynthesis
VDLAIFRPDSKSEARRELGLASNSAILLYVANGGPKNPFKVFHTVRSALSVVSKSFPHPLELLVAGSTGPDDRVNENVVVRQIGYVQSTAYMAQLFRAADVYVHASLEDPFGLSLCEALVCGTPLPLMAA